MNAQAPEEAITVADAATITVVLTGTTNTAH